MVLHACSLGTGEVETGRSEVQGYLPIHTKFETSLGDMSLCQKKREEEEAEEKDGLCKMFIRQQAVGKFDFCAFVKSTSCPTYLKKQFKKKLI